MGAAKTPSVLELQGSSRISAVQIPCTRDQCTARGGQTPDPPPLQGQAERATEGQRGSTTHDKVKPFSTCTVLRRRFVPRPSRLSMLSSYGNWTNLELRAPVVASSTSASRLRILSLIASARRSKTSSSNTRSISDTTLSSAHDLLFLNNLIAFFNKRPVDSRHALKVLVIELVLQSHPRWPHILDIGSFEEV
jgi:hypothetical protein